MMTDAGGDQSQMSYSQQTQNPNFNATGQNASFSNLAMSVLSQAAPSDGGFGAGFNQ
jgi:hypothetical protein